MPLGSNKIHHYWPSVFHWQYGIYNGRHYRARTLCHQYHLPAYWKQMCFTWLRLFVRTKLGVFLKYSATFLAVFARLRRLENKSLLSQNVLGSIYCSKTYTQFLILCLLFLDMLLPLKVIYLLDQLQLRKNLQLIFCFSQNTIL